MRLLRTNEHGAATEALALAFDEDPMFRFLLPGEEERRRWLRIIMAGTIAAVAPAAGVFTTEGVRGVIGVVPPGPDPRRSFRLARFLLRPSRRPKLSCPSRHLRIAGLALLGLMDRLHIKEPHYYVAVLGVHPAHQGKGVARSLLGPIADKADRERVSVYLETTKESNLGLYRHFGFEVMADVTLPSGSPPLWAMLRPPASGGHSGATGTSSQISCPPNQHTKPKGHEHRINHR